MARFDLTDFEWSVIQPLLPNKPRGVARVDDRRVLNGIFWRLQTGAPWADIPERYGPHTTASIASTAGARPASGTLFSKPCQRFTTAISRLFFDPRPSARRRPSKKDQRSRCVGRSRGGLTTKIHALVGAGGLPIELKLTEGQAHDGRSASDMLDALVEGQILLADRAYDSDALRPSWPGLRSISERSRQIAVAGLALKKVAFSPSSRVGFGFAVLEAQACGQVGEQDTIGSGRGVDLPMLMRQV